MAKLPSQFKWAIQRGLVRRLTGKADPNRLSVPGPEESQEEVNDDHSIASGSSTVRYNVCKNRPTACQKFIFDRRNVQKREAGLQDDYDILEAPEEPKRPDTRRPRGGYREFPASTTYKNVTLPLKSSRLAHPFPEPVKLMPSHKISDQEKADQMQADFRVPRVDKKRQR